MTSFPGFLTPREFRESVEENEEAGFLLDGLIPLNGVTMLVGPPFAGKTIFMASLWAHMSAEMPFGGREVTPGTAILLSLEHSGIATTKVLDRAARGVGLDGIDRLEGFIKRSFSVEDTAQVEALLKCAAGIDARAIFVDSFRRAHSEDENSSQTTGALGQVFASLCDGVVRAIVILHHPNHAGSGPRGSTDIPSWCDHVVRVGMSKRDSTVLTLDVSSHTAPPLRFQVRLEYSPDATRVIECAEVGQGSDDDQQDVEEAIRQALAQGPLTTTGLREAVRPHVRVRHEDIDLAVSRLVAAAKVVDRGTPHKHLWSLPSTQGQHGAGVRTRGWDWHLLPVRRPSPAGMGFSHTPPASCPGRVVPARPPKGGAGAGRTQPEAAGQSWGRWGRTREEAGTGVLLDGCRPQPCRAGRWCSSGPEPCPERSGCRAGRRT